MSAGAQIRDVLPGKHDPAGAAIKSADAVEDAGLARSVGADQCEQLPRFDGERDAVQHLQPAKAEREALHFELSHTTSGFGDIA